MDSLTFLEKLEFSKLHVFPFSERHGTKASKMDGKLPTAFLADEAGAMDSYPVEAMRSGQITLKNKLGIVISTEYYFL